MIRGQLVQDDTLLSWDNQCLIEATRAFGCRDRLRYRHAKASIKQLLAIPAPSPGAGPKPPPCPRTPSPRPQRKPQPPPAPEPQLPEPQLEAAKADRPADLPVPQWGELSLGSIRARLGRLSEDDLVALLDHEERHGGSAAVLNMLCNRLTKGSAGRWLRSGRTLNAAADEQSAKARLGRPRSWNTADRTFHLP